MDPKTYYITASSEIIKKRAEFLEQKGFELYDEDEFSITYRSYGKNIEVSIDFERYSDTGAGVNLSFGFHCPMVIEKVFANYYGISEKNGFVYDGNDALAQILTTFVEMPADNYRKIRAALAEDAENKYITGLNNLKKLL